MTRLHDFGCPDCGEQLLNVVIPDGVRAQDVGFGCLCGGSLVWMPSRVGMNVWSTNQQVTIPVEDPGSPSGFRDVRVSSLQDVRRLEHDSGVAEANGTGRQMVWRDYSQDRSQRLDHTLGKDPSLTPAKHTSQGHKVTVGRGPDQNAMARELDGH